ncbi:hypothetical protein ABW636_18095 [Aquimarina sp. 2201CG1-2-11]|uniref:hypothetical protein n=1 Tax=Aquimarina discodermiae TaxID=3231043 RepID=UPI0034625795
MKKLIYVVAYILALGIVACGSDDGAEPVDCGQARVEVADLGNTYRENTSTNNCSAYKTSIESYLSNSCSLDDDEKLIWEKELATLGDCTIAGKICLLCTNSDITIVVCRGENGSTFIDDKDIGVPFDTYVERSTCE